MKRVMLTAILMSVLATVSYAGGGFGPCGAGMGPGGGFGRDHGHGGPGNPFLNAPWNRIERIGQQIGLNEKQLDDLKKIRTDHRHKVDPLMTELKTAEDDLQDMLLSNSPGPQKDAEKLADEINAIRVKIDKERISVHYAVNALLTADQKSKLREFFEKNREDRPGRFADRNRFRSPPDDEQDNPSPEDDVNQ
jgi:Spy/CpxP family protein refolding chaperone